MDLNHLDAIFAVYLPGNHYSWNFRPHEQTDWISISSKARSEGRSLKKERWRKSPSKLPYKVKYQLIIHFKTGSNWEMMMGGKSASPFISISFPLLTITTRVPLSCPFLILIESGKARVDISYPTRILHLLIISE